MLYHRVDVPRLEHDLMRDPSLGFEPIEHCGIVRCLEHGFPTPLARWHYHDEYEIQLILESRGQAFIGDYVGNFEPGHLVLTGPRLPHNWITTSSNPRASRLDRLAIQFADAPLRRALESVPELSDLQHLLDSSRHGIEFFGLGHETESRFHAIKDSRGTRRFSEFLGLLASLAACRDFRLLSTSPVALHDEGAGAERLNRVIEFVHEHYMDAISMQDVYEMAGMSASTFARTFGKVTGTSFTTFVNRVRVAKAADLLMHTTQYVAQIAFDVGFNNLANFNRHFAEMKKMTPSEFRRAARARLGLRDVASN